MNTQLLDKRKEKVLQIIIEDYVSTGHPVGSAAICEKHNLQYSPATIRWDMMELEDDNFIAQTHTSSGRIPTDKGYRYYINNIMQTKTLTDREEEYINQTFEQTNQNIEQILHQTSKILSAVAEYAAIVTSKASQDKLYMGGISNMLRQQEFTDAKSFMPILEAIDDEEPIIETLSDAQEEKAVVKIGSENKRKEIKSCSVVMRKYNSGAIGIIGPTRMNYRKTTCLVDYVSNLLNKLMEEV